MFTLILDFNQHFNYYVEYVIKHIYQSLLLINIDVIITEGNRPHEDKLSS